MSRFAVVLLFALIMMSNGFGWVADDLSGVHHGYVEGGWWVVLLSVCSMFVV